MVVLVATAALLCGWCRVDFLLRPTTDDRRPSADASDRRGRTQTTIAGPAPGHSPAACLTTG